MNISRGPLLAKLNECAPGLAAKETVEQSTCFVFKGGKLYAFNDEIMVSTATEIPFDAAVPAAELLGVLSRLPDDEIGIDLKGGKLKITGARRSAGIAVATEVNLPFAAVPAPEKWARLGEGVAGAIAQAAKVAGKDETQYLATCVHVAPDRVEACDNFRMIRTSLPTGLENPALLPASSAEELEGLELTKVARSPGWLHFKTGAGAALSVRVSEEAYHAGIDGLLDLESPQSVTLPANLGEILERAEVFSTGKDGLVSVRIASDELSLTSRKDGGWYREKKRVKYAGRPLDFDINPKFLADVLKHTREVEVDDSRMAISYDRTRFVVALTAKERKDDSDE